jgi:hypothetical protein
MKPIRLSMTYPWKNPCIGCPTFYHPSEFRCRYQFVCLGSAEPIAAQNVAGPEKSACWSGGGCCLTNLLHGLLRPQQMHGASLTSVCWYTSERANCWFAWFGVKQSPPYHCVKARVRLGKQPAAVKRRHVPARVYLFSVTSVPIFQRQYSCSTETA